MAFQRSIFGQGVLVSRSAEGLALISVVDGENSVVQDVVTSVFNGSYFLDLHFEQHDKDLFYFVKVLKFYAAAVLTYFPVLAHDVCSNLWHSRRYTVRLGFHICIVITRARMNPQLRFIMYFYYGLVFFSFGVTRLKNCVMHFLC